MPYYKNEVISYHVDIITGKYLQSFLKIIDRKMQVIKNKFQQQKEEVMTSIDRLLIEYKSLENKPKTYRKHLEYIF